MAEGIASPTLSYVGGTARLPSVVENVVKDIQRLIVEDKSGAAIPHMPREFVCTEVVDNALKRKRLDLAKEDNRQDIPDPKCYEIAVPFLIRRDREVNDVQNTFIWSRQSALKFYKDSSNQLNYVELIGYYETVTKQRLLFTGENNLEYIRIPDDLKQIKRKILRKFYQSALVQKNQESSYFVSSEKLTITWLRSRLNRALNKYRNEVQRHRGSDHSDVHVVPTIKQKEGSPLFLRLHVRHTEGRNDEVVKNDFLFNIFPAFRLTKCELLVPVFEKLDEVKQHGQIAKEFLFRTVTMCTASPSHKHKVANFMHIGPGTTTINKPMTEKAKQNKTSSEEKEAYKTSINVRLHLSYHHHYYFITIIR